MSTTEQLMFDFDVTPEWTPLFHAPFDWTIYEALPKTEAVAMWKAYRATWRCRDCGRHKFTWSHACGGANAGGSYDVCDDCAALDGCRLRTCEPETGRRKSVLNGTDVAWCSCGWFVFEKFVDDEGVYRPHTVDEVAVMCERHMVPRHVSRWGLSHSLVEHEQLMARQAKHRAAYRLAVAA